MKHDDFKAAVEAKLTGITLTDGKVVQVIKGARPTMRSYNETIAFWPSVKVKFTDTESAMHNDQQNITYGFSAGVVRNGDNETTFDKVEQDIMPDFVEQIVTLLREMTYNPSVRIETIELYTAPNDSGILGVADFEITLS